MTELPIAAVLLSFDATTQLRGLALLPRVLGANRRQLQTRVE